MSVYLGTNQVSLRGGITVEVNGTDTSDATATASDMANGKTAYVDGEIVTGTLKDGGTFDREYSDPDFITNYGTSYIRHNATITEDAIVRYGDSLITSIEASNYGNATAADVASGKTFTSSSGLKITGTATIGGGLVVKSGTTTSATISTGLSSVSYFAIYKSSIAATGLIQAIYNGSTATYVSCSSYSTWSKQYTNGTLNPTISGGTITWNGTNTTALSSNTTYNWIAFGEE